MYNNSDESIDRHGRRQKGKGESVMFSSSPSTQWSEDGGERDRIFDGKSCN